jgi:GTP cyclohydrolase III
MTTRPFNAQKGANQVLTANSSSQSVTVDADALSVRVVNSGTSNIAHVRIGKGPQTATTSDTPIRANSEIVLSKASGDDTLAYISASGTTLHVQDGTGGV